MIEKKWLFCDASQIELSQKNRRSPSSFLVHLLPASRHRGLAMPPHPEVTRFVHLVAVRGDSPQRFVNRRGIVQVEVGESLLERLGVVAQAQKQQGSS